NGLLDNAQVKMGAPACQAEEIMSKKLLIILFFSAGIVVGGGVVYLRQSIWVKNIAYTHALTSLQKNELILAKLQKGDVDGAKNDLRNFINIDLLSLKIISEEIY